MKYCALPGNQSQVDLVWNDSVNRPERNLSGFTLIEHLAVLSIVAVIVGLIVGLTNYVRTTTDNARALVELDTLCDELERFRANRGSFPTNNAEWEMFTNALPQEISVQDPWGTPYQFTNRTARTYRIFSKGADRLAGTPELDLDNIQP